MFFIWFAIKLYVFDAVFSMAIGFLFLPLALWAVSTKADSTPNSEPIKRAPVAIAVMIPLLFIACSVYGATIAASVKFSLLAHPDAWWPLWYLLGLSAAIPAKILAGNHKETQAQVAQLLCMVGAIGGYGIICVWSSAVPPVLILRIAYFLSV